MRTIILISTIIVYYLTNFAFAIDRPEDFVNLLAGTFTDGNYFSTGNTLPLIGLPWGFNHWAPQTKEGGQNAGSWWFRGNDHTLTWLRCTHQPSPWIGDWAWFLFSPQIDGVDRNPAHQWEPRGAIIRPHLFDATLAPHGIRVELAPTMHAAAVRITFPSRQADKRLCFAEASWAGDSGRSGTGKGGVHWINGRTDRVHVDRMVVSGFKMLIRIESSQASGVEHHQDMACLSFPREAVSVTVSIATSFISEGQALLNLEREAPPSKPFDQVASEARTVWNRLLRRVDIVDAGGEFDESDDTPSLSSAPQQKSHSHGSGISAEASRHVAVFYTSLARALAFPRRLDELDSSGQVVHYSPYATNGGVHPGPLCTDNGFWDTFRTVYPMLGLLYPDLLGPIVQGWLNAYKEGGWLPSWASPGYRNCMVGTYADVVVSDAIVKRIPDFDLRLARDALMKDAFEAPPRFTGNAVGKEGLEEYMRAGYVSVQDRGGDQVSRTLDFGFADYSTAQAFRVLADPSLPFTSSSSSSGLSSLFKSSSSSSSSSSHYDFDPLQSLSPALSSDEKETLLRRSKELLSRSDRAYKSLFDPHSGFMAPKRASGEINRYNTIEWGNGFTEGNAWHHSFPPYALEGLVSLHGSKERLLNKLHEMLTTPSNFLPGTYGQEIHEMREMRALAMGQYGHNNQPSHHLLYLFGLLGERRTMEEKIREVLERGYGVDFYAGDEDNGEQGAWFVLSSLGLFSTTPGTPYYVLGSPLFRHVRVARKGSLIDSFHDAGVWDHKPQAQTQQSSGEEEEEDVYLDIVALGSSLTTRASSSLGASPSHPAHVEDVLWAPASSPPSSPSSYTRLPITQPLDSSLGSSSHSLIDDALLRQGGVLRFVMEGEKDPVSGEIPCFHPGVERGTSLTSALQPPPHPQPSPGQLRLEPAVDSSDLAAQDQILALQKEKQALQEKVEGAERKVSDLQSALLKAQHTSTSLSSQLQLHSLTEKAAALGSGVGAGMGRGKNVALDLLHRGEAAFVRGEEALLKGEEVAQEAANAAVILTARLAKETSIPTEVFLLLLLALILAVWLSVRILESLGIGGKPQDIGLGAGHAWRKSTAHTV